TVFLFFLVVVAAKEREKRRVICEYQPTPKCKRAAKSIYRTIDGSCNNLKHPKWGKSYTCYPRFMDANYPDVYGHDIMNPMLLNARKLSNSLFKEDVPHKSDKHNLMLMNWGQILANEMTYTSGILLPLYFRQIEPCCNGSEASFHPQCAPIFIPRDDFLNKDLGHTCMNFVRSEDIECFVSGDDYVNSNPWKTAVQTVFVREHNRLATLYRNAFPHLDDDELFQRARRILIAKVQMITYNEFLPAFFGPDLMEEFKLAVLKNGYTDYDENIDPSTTIEFSTAAFRAIGHSMVSSDTTRRLANGNVIKDQIDYTWHHIVNFTKGRLDQYIRGYLFDPSNKIDMFLRTQCEITWKKISTIFPNMEQICLL
ncbi:peroxidase-like protein, partial [Dinothrombium tinctorium]